MKKNKTNNFSAEELKNAEIIFRLKRAKKEIKQIMQKSANEIISGQVVNLYSLDAHRYLMTGPWELLLPMDKTKWPERFKLAELKLKPGFDIFDYYRTIPVFSEEDLSSLRLGYAVVAGKLQKAMFFVSEGFLGNEKISHTMAIDIFIDVEADYYLGCPVEVFDLSRSFFCTKDPLERFIEKKTAEELKLIKKRYEDESRFIQNLEEINLPGEKVKRAVIEKVKKKYDNCMVLQLNRNECDSGGWKEIEALESVLYQVLLPESTAEERLITVTDLDVGEVYYEISGKFKIYEDDEQSSSYFLTFHQHINNCLIEVEK